MSSDSGRPVPSGERARVSRSGTPFDAAPERATLILLLASLFGFFFRGYAVYSHEEHAGGVGPYLDFVHGVGPAPFQYRIGVIRVAYWFYAHLHVPFRYGFAILDGLASVVAVLLAYRLLRRSALYLRAPLALRWFASAAFTALVLYLLAWQDWYKKSDTEPSAALVMLMVTLWAMWASRRRKISGLVIAAGLLALTVVQSFIRADVALSLNLGFLAASLLARNARRALPFPAAPVVAAAGVVLAAGIQALLIRVIFPHARAYDGPVLMLPHDIGKPAELAEFFSFILPAVWTGWQAWRRRFTADTAGLGVLLACLPFVALWMLLGRIEEVRIFLPLALALCPLSVEMLLLSAGADEDRAAAA